MLLKPGSYAIFFVLIFLKFSREFCSFRDNFWAAKRIPGLPKNSTIFVAFRAAQKVPFAAKKNTRKTREGKSMAKNMAI
jgi:hypothetical protein